MQSVPTNPADEPTASQRTATWCAAALIACATLVAYIPALHGSMVWDDDAHVTAPWLRGLAGLRSIWFQVGATQQYYPVLHSAFWIEHRLWGDSVVGYHAANILLHILSSCLFAVVLARVRAGGSRRSLPGAGDWLAAALFALHPVCAESVAWISEQKNTLSLFFYLLAALAYLRFDRERRAGSYVLALGLFVLALLSKSVTATLPAALLLVFAWQNGRIAWRRDVVPLLPFFALGISSGLFTAWVERSYIGAHGAAYGLSFLERLFLSGRVVWFYLGKILWPSDLSFMYPRWTVVATAGWSVGVTGVAITVCLLWRIRRSSPALLLGFLFFVGSLFPALGFFNVYPFIFSYVADHWQYLPSLGIFALAGEGMVSAGRGFAGKFPGAAARVFSWIVCLALLSTLCVLTRSQAALYRDVPTLYSDTISKNPESWMAHGNLGVYLMDQGSTPEAVAHFRKAIALNPAYADAHNNLGNALLREPGQGIEAVAEFEEAIRLNPAMAEAHANLALALVHTPGRFNDGVEQFRIALKGREHDPRSARLHADFGMALAQARDGLTDAVREEEQAIALEPDLATAHYGLGIALGREGRGAESVAQYREALRLGMDTAEVHNGLGSALMRGGEQADAALEFAKAVSIQPSSAALRNNLGIALTGLGRLGEAITSLREAVRLQPSFADAHYNLGLALERSGRGDEAQSEFGLSGRARR